MRPILLCSTAFVALVSLVSTSALAVTPTQRCSATKVHAVARALGCVAKQHNDALLTGAAADVAHCNEKLASSFAIGEAGSCPTMGDAPDAVSLVEQTSTTFLAALGAGGAGTEASKRCVAAKNRSGARYAACAAKRWARVFVGIEPPAASDDDRCFAKLADAFVRAEKSDSCPTTGDAVVSRHLLGPVSAWLPGADLRNAILTGAFAYGARLAGANLHGVRLHGADLREADLSGATLESAIVDGADVAGADLSGADLTRFHAFGVVGCPARLPQDWTCTGGILIGPSAHISSGDLSDLDLSGLNLNGIYAYGGVTMVNTNLAAANLAGAVLDWADMTGADLSAADMTAVRLSACNLRNASLTNALLDNAGFSYTSVYGADFSGVDLTLVFMGPSRWVGLSACPAALPPGYRCVQNTIFGPNLFVIGAEAPGSDLSGIDLSPAYLTDSDLSGANLTGADLTGSVTRTTFAGADLTEVEMSASSLINNDFTGALLTNADLHGSNLAASNFTGADVSGADLSNVYWLEATCPDGTTSATNGGTCCGHHVGGAPLACSP